MNAAIITVHGPREGDRHIFPGTTLDNHPTERHATREFAGEMSQSPARERLPAIIERTAKPGKMSACGDKANPLFKRGRGGRVGRACNTENESGWYQALLAIAATLRSRPRRLCRPRPEAQGVSLGWQSLGFVSPLASSTNLTKFRSDGPERSSRQSPPPRSPATPQRSPCQARRRETDCAFR